MPSGPGKNQAAQSLHEIRLVSSLLSPGPLDRVAPPTQVEFSVSSLLPINPSIPRPYQCRWDTNRPRSLAQRMSSTKRISWSDWKTSFVSGTVMVEPIPPPCSTQKLPRCATIPGPQCASLQVCRSWEGACHRAREKTRLLSRSHEIRIGEQPAFPPGPWIEWLRPPRWNSQCPRSYRLTQYPRPYQCRWDTNRPRSLAQRMSSTKRISWSDWKTSFVSGTVMVEPIPPPCSTQKLLRCATIPGPQCASLQVCRSWGGCLPSGPGKTRLLSRSTKFAW